MSLKFVTKTIQINGNTSRILLQNENGPCALVALANVLLLSPGHAGMAKELRDLVTRNATISLNDLVQTFASIAIHNPNGANTDVNELLHLLPQLHTGLNINPRFNGSFADSTEMAIFRLYNVGIVHGWIIDPEQDSIAYDHVSRYSYEEAQAILVQAYDLKNADGAKTDGQQQILDDASYIKPFLARSATQFTEYGLQHLREILMEGSYAILFRNDHFATIYKSNGTLYTLVTDLGYQDRKDIVWQSITSVNGSRDVFYTGDFIHTTLANSNATEPVQMNAVVSNPFSDQNQDSNMGVSRVETTRLQQVEDDEELARRLQQEEDREAAGSIQREYENAHAEWKAKKDKNGRRKASQNGKTKKRDKMKKACIVM